MNDLRKWIDAINQEPQEVIEEITLEDEQDFHDEFGFLAFSEDENDCLLYTSPSPRDCQ